MSKMQEKKRRLFRVQHGTPLEAWGKFWEYLVVEASIVGTQCPNWQAQALFEMIQLAFDGSGAGGKGVQIDPYLIHNLAACATLACRTKSKERIPWEDHDDILNRTFSGFAWTVISAILNRKTIIIEHKVYLGGLLIPEWFVTHATTECSAAHSYRC
jgi:hypothetical protein